MGVIQKYSDQIDLMGEMFRKTGAFEGATPGLDLAFDLRGAMATCSKCRNTLECKAWMADAGDREEAPEFCPNHKRITRMKRGF